MRVCVHACVCMCAGVRACVRVCFFTVCETVGFFLCNPSAVNMNILAWKVFIFYVQYKYHSFIYCQHVLEVCLDLNPFPAKECMPLMHFLPNKILQTG